MTPVQVPAAAAGSVGGGSGQLAEQFTPLPTPGQLFGSGDETANPVEANGGRSVQAGVPFPHIRHSARSRSAILLGFLSTIITLRPRCARP